MTTVSQSVLELFIQVTLWSTVGIVLLAIVNRYSPLRLAPVALCFLAGVVVLTMLVWVPWPSWIATDLPQSSTPVGSIEHAPHEEVNQTGTGFTFSLALKSWQRLMPTLPAASPAVRPPVHAISWSLWGLMILGCGMVIGALQLLLAFRYARAQLSMSTELKDRVLLQERDQISKAMGLKRSVLLLESPTLTVPATVGYWKPTVLLPANWTTWSIEDCRTVLAHELAHIRRTDYLMMVMTQIITIVYWFHPLVRGMSRWMRCGQELAADALAVRVLGDQPSYLRSLCRLALDQDGARLPAPARLFLSPEVSLFRRIAMLREGTRKVPGSGRVVRWCLAMVLVVTGTVVASLRSSAVADEPKSKPAPASSTEWQRYVDAKAPGYVVFRPATAMSLTSMQPHREKLNKLFKEELSVLFTTSGMGVPLDAVECFAGPLHVELRKNGLKGTGTMNVRGVYFQLRTREDAEAWIKHCTFSLEKIDHQLGTYYKSNAKPSDALNGSYLLRPDERTIVFAASEKQLLGWLEDAKKPVTVPAWMAGMPNDTGIISVAIDMKSDLIRKSVLQAGEGASMNPMFKPVYEHDGSMVCTLLNADSLAFDLRLVCTTAEDADKKKKQLDGLVNMLKIVQVTGTTNSNPEKEADDRQLLSDLLKNMKSSQFDGIVRLETNCAMKLGDAIKNQVVEMTGKVERK